MDIIIHIYLYFKASCMHSGTLVGHYGSVTYGHAQNGFAPNALYGNKKQNYATCVVS